MSDPTVLTRTAQDIIGTRTASKAIEEIFNVIHPAPVKTALGDIFTAESAQQFFGRIGKLTDVLSVEDDHATALAKLDARIYELEKVRDTVLAELYAKIRPIEKSYRSVQLFFENSEVTTDTMQRPPVDFFIYNADTSVIKKDVDSTTLVAVNNFVRTRNDTLNFRQFICNMVLPGYVPDNVRHAFEDIASKWGMLLIGDLKDEPNFRKLQDQFRTDGGAYEFLKRPEDRAASDVIVAGYMKVRERHWFEQAEAHTDDADMYVPASMIFAGALARTDRTTGGGIAQGPVGMVFGKIKGVERSRVELLLSEMEALTMQRHVVTTIRSADNDLCFVGSRTQADDPNGVLKFFSSYRVLRYLERRIGTQLRQVQEMRLTRELAIESVRNPIELFLEEEKKKGTIFKFSLDIDLDEDKLAQGVLDIALEVLPVGPAEVFNLKIDVPKFGGKKDGA